MNDASLGTMMYRIRRGMPFEGDRSTVAKALVYLSALMLNELGGSVEIADYFKRLAGDSGNPLRLTGKGLSLLKKPGHRKGVIR